MIVESLLIDIYLISIKNNEIFACQQFANRVAKMSVENHEFSNEDVKIRIDQYQNIIIVMLI